jgi:hypothetical protein
MRKTWARLAIILVFSLLIAGCSNENDAFIQGSWYYLDPHLNNLSGESHLEVTWSFAGGTFEFHSCCFNGEFYQTGRYDIVRTEEDLIVLELFNIRGSSFGSGEERGRIRIEIDREEDTLTVQASGPFTRTAPRLP